MYRVVYRFTRRVNMGHRATVCVVLRGVAALVPV